MTRAPLVLAFLAVAAAPAAAQSDRLTISMVPAANQTLRFHNAQDIDMTTEAAAPADRPSPMPPIAVKMHSVIDATSTIGPTDNQGHYSAKMAIDQLSITATMNGQPLPLPAAVGETAAKQIMTMSFDDQGTLTDFSIEGNAPAGLSDGLKKMMTSAFARLAPMTLSVGESVTVPVALTIPLPGAAGLGMTGDTTYTLTAITFDGADRIAHLTLRTANTMASGATPGPIPVAMSMTIAGDGKMDVNVDRGIVVHAEQRATIESLMEPPAAAAKASAPRMRMRGTFTSVSDLVKP